MTTQTLTREFYAAPGVRLDPTLKLSRRKPSPSEDALIRHATALVRLAKGHQARSAYLTSIDKDRARQADRAGDYDERRKRRSTLYFERVETSHVGNLIHRAGLSQLACEQLVCCALAVDTRLVHTPLRYDGERAVRRYLEECRDELNALAPQLEQIWQQRATQSERSSRTAEQAGQMGLAFA